MSEEEEDGRTGWRGKGSQGCLLSVTVEDMNPCYEEADGKKKRRRSVYRWTSGMVESKV